MPSMPLIDTGTFRFRYLICLALAFLIINMGLRVILQVEFTSTLPFSGAMFPGLLEGLLNDCATLVNVLLLPATLILLPTGHFLHRPTGRIYAVVILFLFLTLFIFTAVAEYYFWEEFKSRFNFIAVDYLIYTTELMQNMVESYPLFRLLAGIGIVAALATALLWRRLRRFLPENPAVRVSGSPADFKNASRMGRPLQRLTALGGLYAVALLLFIVFTPLGGSENRYWNEYAKNGVYELLSAYFHNQLDYRAFYQTMDKREAFAIMRENMSGTPESTTPQKDMLVRRVLSDAPEKSPNVIIVIMESMGSNWRGEYTPNLNKLADEGLEFTRMLSTGTRTVRGIEAIMLSVPPTPGNSIVRRPDNDRLFNLGTLFREKGYELNFIYGGFGYFDNMNAFFAGNGYTVYDKLDFAETEKTYSNAWGQCDEDLFAESLRLAAKSYSAGKPFQQVLLTTSNHRPFTFPEGKIDMDTGSRRAAVKYSDYAIGQFMEKARQEPWFDDTVFVFVGDHPSSIAGKTEIPADEYGIVCILYGPRYFQPDKINTLCSQIDLAPTLLASLGWDYLSQFFGTDARTIKPENGRAWISTYQLLGYRTNDVLVVLEPHKGVEVDRLGKDGQETPDHQAANIRSPLVRQAVASYQCAYDLFTNKTMKESMVLALSKLKALPQEPHSDSNHNFARESSGAVLQATLKKLLGLWIAGEKSRL